MQKIAGSKVLWALLIFFLFTFQSSFGDKIILKNGSTFEGKIIKETDRVVILKISGMGKMTFQKSQISQILREKPSEKKEPTKKEGKAKKVPLFLWKVKGKEAYLFGTIHGYVNIYALSPTPLEKLKSSLYVILETDLKKIDRALIQKYGFFPKGESLDQKLPKDLWEKVKKALPNAPKDRLKKIKPWVLNFILGTKYHPSGSVAMDATLYNEALKAKITLEFLETPDEQFQMLDKVHQVNPQKTIDELQEMLDQPSKYKKKVQTLAKLYKKGDPSALEKFVFQDAKKYPQAFDLVFYERNRNWIPKICKAVERDRCFIAVGAGHLLGPKGVLELLKKKGYTLERVWGKAPSLASPQTSSLNLQNWKKIKTAYFTFMVPQNFQQQNNPGNPFLVASFSVPGEKIFCGIFQYSPSKESLKEILKGFMEGLQQKLPKSTMIKTKSFSHPKGYSTLYAMIESKVGPNSLYYYVWEIRGRKKIYLLVTMNLKQFHSKYFPLFQKIFESFQEKPETVNNK